MHSTDELLDAHTEYIVSLYREVEQQLIYSIVDMMNRHGRITGTAEISLQTLYEMGGLDAEVIEVISELTGYPLQELQKAVAMISIGSVDFKTLNEAYDKGLITVKPEIVMLDTIIQETSSLMGVNMDRVRTTVTQYALQDFKRAVDKGLLDTRLGVKTEQEAVVDVVKQLSRDGITSAVYEREGKPVRMGLEPYMRRMIRTEFVQTMAESNLHMGEEVGAKHYYVTQHMGARDKGIGYENHESWQNGIYTKDELVTVCGYGEITGLSGINCRHLMHPHIKGISVPPPPKIDTKANARAYKVSQEQRRLESSIRSKKREINALKRLETPEAQEEVKKQNKLLRNRQAKMRKLVSENEDIIRRRYDREKVVDKQSRPKQVD